MKSHFNKYLVVFVFIILSVRAELVSFTPSLPDDWTKIKEGPVTDAKGGIGNFVACQNKAQNQTIIIQVSEISTNDTAVPFEKMSEDWKEGLLDSIRAKKHEPQEINFRPILSEKKPEAEISFQVQGNQHTLFYCAKCYRSGNRLVSILALGIGVKTKDDEVVTSIIKSVVVK
jgi:hypothetical protein